MSHICARFLVAAVAAVSAPRDEDVGFVSHATRHYEVLVDEDCEDAERKGREWGAMLQQARDEFREFFHAKASPTVGTRFVVRVHADVETWKARILDEGGALPAKVDRVWYRQDNEYVYVVEQPTEYWTRGQLLYGACQQYFGAVAPERRHLLYGWYLHGIASSFALHRWNGEEGEFAIVPWVTDSGMPEEALANLDPANVALDRFNIEELDTSSSWGVVTYLLEGADAKIRKRFEKLALGTTGSAVSSSDLAHAFGGTLGDLQAQLYQWLLENQPPFELIAGTWEDVGDRELRASVPPGEYGTCLLRPDVGRLEADLSIPFQSPVGAGFVTGYRDEDHFAEVFVQESHLSVVLHSGPDRGTLAHLPIDARRGDTYPLRIQHRDDGLHVTVRRVKAGPFPISAEGRSGLLVKEGPARFLDVSWE